MAELKFSFDELVYNVEYVGNWKPYTLLKIVGYGMECFGNGKSEEYYHVIAADDNSDLPERRQVKEKQLKLYKGQNLKKQRLLDIFSTIIIVIVTIILFIICVEMKGGVVL